MRRWFVLAVLALALGQAIVRANAYQPAGVAPATTPPTAAARVA